MDAQLYMVATPIGNLKDITVRALEVLKSVDVIACEDTRHTRAMLNHFGIDKRTIACHSHNEMASAQGIINLLREGKSVAYVSDAGTPGVSDPGARLCNAVREASFTIVPLPGASACVSLISVAGLTGGSWFFEGFLSPKSGRRKKRLQVLFDREDPFIVYESPYRVVKLLKEMAEIAPDRELFAGREMTKVHEEFLSGTALEIAEVLESRPAVKGEFAILVKGVQK